MSFLFSRSFEISMLALCKDGLSELNKQLTCVLLVQVIEKSKAVLHHDLKYIEIV